MGRLRDEARLNDPMRATAQMQRALRHLASRGQLKVRREANIVLDEVATRTASALERRGWAERRWVGGDDGVIYITDAGMTAANVLDDICELCGEELVPHRDECTNPDCDNWRFAEEFDRIAPR